MLFRFYSPNDFTALYAIEEACFQPPHRFSRTYMHQLIGQSEAATWVAEDGGRMLGFAIVEWTREITGMSAYIQTIEVLPGERRHGLGDELLSRMEGSAGAAGAARIQLHVDADNAAAIRLYERHGYGLCGRQENYYGRGKAGLIYGRTLTVERTG